MLAAIVTNVRWYVQLPQLRGGMCFCRLAWRDESFSIFLLVIRGKNHDTKRESPAGAGAACAALVMNFGSYLNHLLFIGVLTCFLQLITKRGTEGNCIYRPVMLRRFLRTICYLFIISLIFTEYRSNPPLPPGLFDENIIRSE